MEPKRFQFRLSWMMQAIFWFAIAAALVGAFLRRLSDPYSERWSWLLLLAFPALGASIGSLWGRPGKGATVVIGILLANAVLCGVLFGILRLIFGHYFP